MPLSGPIDTPKFSLSCSQKVFLGSLQGYFPKLGLGLLLVRAGLLVVNE